MIHADQAQNRRIDVMDIERRFLRAQAELVACPEHLPAFDARARHPHAERIRMVVAAVFALRERRAAEFAAPHHESRIQQAARFQVG